MGMDAEAVVRAVFDGTNRRDLTALEALHAPELVLNGQTTTFAKFAESFPAFFAAFPDAHGVVDECFGDGERVVVRWTTAATHHGEYAGVGATGRAVSWQGINTYRVVDGRVVEMWQSADALGLLRQIDAVVEPPRLSPRRETGPRSGIFQFEVKSPPKNGGSGPA